MFQKIYASIGPAGCALILVGCASLYLSLKNLFYLHFVRKDFNRNFLDVEKEGGRALSKVCAESGNPLISIIRDVVTIHAGHSEDIRAEVAYLFHRNFEPVMKRLCYLRLIAVVSPLLGLLGTILGMVTVFQTIADNSVPDAAQLAAGIWEALITTIMGLSIAIPSLMVYYFLTLKFKGFHIDAIEYSYRAIELCTGVRRAGPVFRAAHKPRTDEADNAAHGSGRMETRHV